jgi:SNF2 family DNA or RNA helicase
VEINLSTSDEVPSVDVVGLGFDDETWTGFTLELGVDVPRGEHRFVLPLGMFLTQRRLLRLVCDRLGVSVSVDAGVGGILGQARQQEVELERILSTPSAEGTGHAAERLRDSRFARDLKDFQIRDLERLLTLPNGANFSVPGAGKTVVALATYEAERLASRVDRLLVVAPLSAFDSWTTEARDSFASPLVMSVFSVDRPIPLATEALLVNYEKLPNHFARVSSWASAGKAHIVVDEAHRIKKGTSGAWGSAVLALAWHGVRRDVLTGTPAPQHPSDLQAMLDFAWPTQSQRVLPPEAFLRPSPPDAGRRVAQAIRPLFVRTRKSELGLREPIKHVLMLELHGLHRDIYLAVLNQYAGAIPLLRRDRAMFARMRAVVMYLLEAATNPALLPVGSATSDPPVFQHPPLPVPSDSNLGELLTDYGRYETPAKFRKLGEIIRQNAEEGRKTLVWSYFVRNLELLKRDLARYEPAMVHGGVPSEVTDPRASPTREAEIGRFRKDPRCQVLLANPAAMGEGISLHHTCHDAIYLERTFNAGQFLQSVDRIHRLGMDPSTETHITFLLTRDTIDEVVADRVRVKAERLGEMMDDPDILTMALPDEDDLEDVETGFGRPIDLDEDVAALFAHLRGQNASG